MDWQHFQLSMKWYRRLKCHNRGFCFAKGPAQLWELSLLCSLAWNVAGANMCSACSYLMCVFVCSWENAAHKFGSLGRMFVCCHHQSVRWIFWKEVIRVAICRLFQCIICVWIHIPAWWLFWRWLVSVCGILASECCRWLLIYTMTDQHLCARERGGVIDFGQERQKSTRRTLSLGLQTPIFYVYHFSETEEFIRWVNKGLRKWKVHFVGNAGGWILNFQGNTKLCYFFFPFFSFSLHLSFSRELLRPSTFVPTNQSWNEFKRSLVSTIFFSVWFVHFLFVLWTLV